MALSTQQYSMKRDKDLQQTYDPLPFENLENEIHKFKKCIKSNKTLDNHIPICINLENGIETDQCIKKYSDSSSCSFLFTQCYRKNARGKPHRR